jgi:hypothetical protein
MLSVRKKIAALLLACCLLCSFYASAQDADPEKASRAMTDKMKTTLNLSEEQYQKAGAINLDFTKAATALRNEDGGRADKMSKLKALRQRRESSLKEVLNEEQFKQFKEQQKENRQTMRGQMRERRQQD